jgi:hypothetical protein
LKSPQVGYDQTAVVVSVIAALAGAWPGPNLSLSYDDGSGGPPVDIHQPNELSTLGLNRRLAVSPTASDATDGRPRIAVVDLGHTGLLGGTAPVPPGFSATVAVGAAVERPVVVRHDDERLIAVRSMILLSLTYVEGVLDSKRAAALLADIRRRVEAA